MFPRIIIFWRCCTAFQNFSLKLDKSVIKNLRLLSYPLPLAELLILECLHLCVRPFVVLLQNSETKVKFFCGSVVKKSSMITLICLCRMVERCSCRFIFCERDVFSWLFSVPEPINFWYGSGSLDLYTWLRIRIQLRIQILTFFSVSLKQCCGYMTFWCGSGSADPCLWLMDPDPTLFITDLKDANKKLI